MQIVCGLFVLLIIVGGLYYFVYNQHMTTNIRQFAQPSISDQQTSDGCRTCPTCPSTEKQQVVEKIIYVDRTTPSVNDDTELEAAAGKVIHLILS